MEEAFLCLSPSVQPQPNAASIFWCIIRDGADVLPAIPDDEPLVGEYPEKYFD
jgi:hypothetical protein